MSILNLATPFRKSISNVWIANEDTQTRPQAEGKQFLGSLAALLLGAFWQRRLDGQAEDSSNLLNSHVDWLIGLNQGIRGG